MGSVAIKNSTVKGQVTNNAKISKSANIVFGKGNTASMGSTEIE